MFSMFNRLFGREINPPKQGDLYIRKISTAVKATLKKVVSPSRVSKSQPIVLVK